MPRMYAEDERKDARGRKRVVVIGGGLGGLSAAWELSEPQLRDEHEVVVLQSGWRLGGKGASGRRTTGDDRRIEEHGLHVWSGIYDNAFAMMRSCYAELDRRPGAPLRTWHEAFRPAANITLWEHIDEEWLPWVVPVPQNGLHPGEPGTDGLLGVSDLILLAIHYVRHREFPRHHPLRAGEMAHECGIWMRILAILLSAIGHTVAALFRLRGVGLLFRLAFFAPAAVFAAWWLRRRWSKTRARLESPSIAAAEKTSIRRRWLVANFAFGNIAGLVKGGTWWSHSKWEELNELDYAEWLGKHLVDDGGLTLQSPLVQFIYDAEFAFEEGDLARPSIAAGVAVRTLVGMALGSKGALVWNLSAGMGDVVFAPLYEALKRRGVRFEFFHRVERIELDQERRRVRAIEVAVQAKLADGCAEYQPLVDVDGLPCWPSVPDWSQLAVDGDRPDFEDPDSKASSTRELYVDSHFDHVVLATPVRVAERIASALADASPAWRTMFASVKTIATQAVQLWLTRGTNDVGFSPEGGTLMGTYRATPLSTLGDVSHVLRLEHWPVGEAPAGLVYACGPLLQTSAVTASVGDVLRTGQPLFPRAFATDGFSWEVLAVPPMSALVGEARLDAQHLRENRRPSEQFTLSLPKTIAQRIAPHRSGFANLVVAGDWTRTGLDISNSEAACLSGRIAARAIADEPLEDLTMPRVGPYAGLDVNRVLPPATRPEWIAAFAIIATIWFGLAAAVSLAWPNAAPGDLGPAPIEWAGIADHGYTVSLLLFVVPCIAFGVWGRYARLTRLQWRAFKAVTLGVFLVGLVMDTLIAGTCFAFPNEHAVLGLRLPGLKAGAFTWCCYPIEELAFYGLGGLLMMQLYVFGDATVFSYGQAIRPARAHKTPFTRRRVVVSVAVVLAPWVVKLLLHLADPDEFSALPPIYFMLLVMIGLVPAGSWLESTYRSVNWRAYIFAYFALLLISLMWEVTLGLP